MTIIPTRIAGPDPPARTPPSRSEVRAWLVAVERGAANEIRQRSRSPGMHAVARWPDVYVKDYITRQYLRGYIWCEAHGHSFEAMCRDRDGWSVRTGRRKAAEGLDAITALLALEIASGGGDVLVTSETLRPGMVKTATV